MMLFFKPTLLKISSILASFITIYSVSGGDDEYGWINWNTTLAPEAFVSDKSYEPLFFTSDMFYGDENYINKYPNRFVKDQITEWNTYVNNEISTEKLQAIIGSDSLNLTVTNVYAAITTNTSNKYSKVYNLNNEKIKQFFKYVHLAKSLETYTNTYPDWNYETDSYTQPAGLKINEAKKIEKIYTATSNGFLKNKYWFLTMKAYFYSDKKQAAIDFFNATANTIEKNTNYYRALSYVAGIYYKTKKYALSNYYNALVFDNCPKLRHVATYDFHPQENTDFNQSLAMAKNKEEKAALWTLYGYYADPVEAINAIYNLDPTNKHLDFLLTRALNIEENKVNEIEYSRYTDKPKIHTEKIDPVFYALVSKIATNNNTTNPHLWKIAAAYFETLKGKYNQASLYLEEAKKNTSTSKLIQNQIKLFEIFNTISKTKTLNTSTENELLPDLVWLFQTNKALQNEYYNGSETKNETSKLRTEFLTKWVRNYLSSLYIQQNNKVFSELFVRERAFYSSKENCTKMEQFLEKQHHTPWETFAMTLYDVSIDDIYEYKGILLTYENKIDAAIAEMTKSKNSTQQLYGNPFNGKIKDCNDCEHEAFQKTKYTKLSFLQKIKEIQTNIANNSDLYSGNLLLGNAFYNLSHYGNARFFYANKIIDQYGNYLEDDYDALLTSNTLAENYYQKAFYEAQNLEEKAKATYMLTKVERNNFYKSPKYLPDEVDFIRFNGYNKLIENYADTKYYAEVIKECGYFRSVAQ